MSYHIDLKSCQRSGKCLLECPMGAIHAEAMTGPVIDPDLCTDCGSCADVCPCGAIRGLVPGD
ncbi:MAG: 4Fe-4S binding protein [bacterium]